MNLGEKIQQLRKARGLSQEQLADNLNVSRQAISKWETNQSSPEIENILALSKVFSISTDELLGNISMENTEAPIGQPNAAKWKPISKRSIRNMFSHIDKKMVIKVIIIIFTLLCFIGIGVCVIVNYAIDQQITWAAYPIVAILLGWLVFVPLIYMKFTISLCVFTVAVIPFLYLLDIITPDPIWFHGLGIPLAATALVFLWVTYLLFRFIKISLWYKAAITVLLSAIVNMLGDYFIDSFLGTETPLFITIITLFACLLVTALLGFIGYTKKKIKKAEKEDEI